MIYIFWTCANIEEAKRIARELLQRRLIACASMMPVESLFRWEEKIDEAKEVKAILKTRRDRFAEVRDYILKHGSYKVPEIAAVKAETVNPSYLNWLESETV